MDTRDLNSGGLSPAAASMIAGYLSELESHLPAARRLRRQILAEVADGLSCAAEEQLRRGLPVRDAARTALAEFGDPRTLAAAFTRQLAPAAAHRMGTGLVLTGPLVGLVWVAAYTTTGTDWRWRIAGMLSATPQVPFILALVVPAAVIAVAGAGRASRYLSVPQRVATGAALVAAVGCVAVDLSLVSAAVIGRGLSFAGPVNLIVVAIVASVARLSAVGWAGRRIAHLRAAAR